MSKQSPKPRSNGKHENVERTNFTFSLNLTERDLLAKAASKAGMLTGRWAREKLLEIAAHAVSKNLD